MKSKKTITKKTTSKKSNTTKTTIVRKKTSKKVSSKKKTVVATEDNLINDILSKIDFKKIDCEYSDVRIEKTFESEIAFVNYELTDISEAPSLGAFLRVYKNGNWAFKSTTNLNDLQHELEQLSINIKELPANSYNNKVVWPKREPMDFYKKSFDSCNGNKKYTSKKSCKCFSLKKKKQLLLNIANYAKKNFKDIANNYLGHRDKYLEKWFRSSDNRSFYYDANQVGILFSYTLIDRKTQNKFSDYVNMFFSENDSKSQEKIIKNKLNKEIKVSRKFINAKAIEPGKYKVLLASDIVGIFTHESFGHKSEADFMIGNTSAQEEFKIGKIIGSEILNIVDEGNIESCSGYCPIDDEGNLKTKTYLIKDGKLSGRLHSMMTSSEFKDSCTGNARAVNFQFEPSVRMTNTYIEKGSSSFKKVLASIESGLYVQGAKHGMGMSTFTIAPTRAFKIKNGKITEPIKVSVLSGSVFETLNLIDAVCDDFILHSSQFGGCGKMEQFPLSVSDGGPTILVREMMVS